MDRNFNELQRYCESHPEDLAAGERLFNHYLRLNDPLFNQLHDYLNGNPKKSEPRVLHELLASFPKESHGPWLSLYVKTKTKNWPERYFAMSGVTYRRYPDKFPFERIAPLITSLHLYSDETSNTDEFLSALCSLFSEASHFVIILGNRDYSEALDCLPASLRRLSLTGELQPMNSALQSVKLKRIDSLKLNLEKLGPHSGALKIPGSIYKSLLSLAVNSVTTSLTTKAWTFNELLESPSPTLTELSLHSVEINSTILSRVTSSLFAPSLKRFESTHCRLGSLSFQGDIPVTDEEKNEVEHLTIVDTTLPPSNLHRILDKFHSKSIYSARIACEGGASEDIRELFLNSSILQIPDLELCFSQIQGLFKANWIESLSSFGLKRLDIRCLEDSLTDPQDSSYAQKFNQIKGLQNRLVSSGRFPNLRKLNLDF